MSAVKSQTDVVEEEPDWLKNCPPDFICPISCDLMKVPQISNIIGSCDVAVENELRPDDSKTATVEVG